MGDIKADEIKAWSDAVGPTFMAFIGIALIIIFLIVPMIKRDKKEGGNSDADIGIYGRLAAIELRIAILWKDWENKR